MESLKTLIIFKYHKKVLLIQDSFFPFIIYFFYKLKKEKISYFSMSMTPLETR